MLFPLAAVGQQRRFRFAHSRDDRTKTFRQPLPGHLPKPGFWVERVEVAWATFHEQKDDAFGLCGEMGRFGGKRICVAGSGRSHRFMPEKISERQRAKARARLREKVASGE